MKKFIIPTLALLSFAPAAASAQEVVTAPSNTVGGAEPDYAAAKAMPMPEVKTLLPASATSPATMPNLGAPQLGGAPSVGDGVMKIRRIAPSKGSSLLDVAPSAGEEFAPQQFGTFNRPFTTARVQLTTSAGQLPTVNGYPYRATGKLFFQDGTSNFVCSASLIRRGLVVTAAHCVARWGQRRFYTNIRYVPAYHNGLAPFGTWSGTPTILTSYFNGTAANCAVAGVVCDNDIAVIRLTAQGGAFPGNSTGFLGYATNNYGFTSAGLTHITQLGYPVALDNGQIEQRTDSQGQRGGAGVSNNTLWGSLQTGGSSGGALVINFGIAPVLNGTSLGSAAAGNRVIGVTSWGYTSGLPKEQGASAFTSSNIIPIINAACGNPFNQAACL